MAYEISHLADGMRPSGVNGWQIRVLKMNIAFRSAGNGDFKKTDVLHLYENAASCAISFSQSNRNSSPRGNRKPRMSFDIASPSTGTLSSVIDRKSG